MKTFLIIALSLVTYSASACECKVMYSMVTNFKAASYVLKVKVLSVNDTSQFGRLSNGELDNLYPPFKAGFSPNLKVLKAYKGKLSKKVIALTGDDYCNDKYTVGQEYVLFIYETLHEGKNYYFTRICENNFLASEKYSLKWLKEIRSELEH